MIRINKTNSFTEEELRCFRKAAKFASDKFLSETQKKKMTIIIDFPDDEFFENVWYGECCFVGIKNGRRQFKIAIKTLVDNRSKNTIVRLSQALRTLFHEMTHVKQYMCGELFDYANGDVKHQGRVYEHGYEYWDSPWEIEAYGMSESLYHQFYQKHHKEFEAKHHGKTET